MPISTEAQALLNDFAGEPGVTVAQVANLRSAVEASPTLVQQLNSAVADGHLRHFALLPPDANAGGTYNGATKTLSLPAPLLASASSGDAAIGELTFVLGHELQHGFNNAATAAAYQTFAQQVRAVAQGPAPVHDYTAAVQALIDANRRDEARAQIAGWNALADRVRTSDPDATLADVYAANPSRMADFLEPDVAATPPGFRLKPGLTTEPGLGMLFNPQNVEAMGLYYFDKPGNVSRLGFAANSSYHNYYGAYAAGIVVATERSLAQPYQGQPPRLTLNMAQLKLDEAVMEQNGIHLGSNTAPAPYYDSSTQPPVLRHFHHTVTTHTHVPIHAQGIHGAGHAGLDPRSPAHPSHALYRDVAAAVERLDASRGRTYDAASERVTASMFALASTSGMRSVSDVVPGLSVPGVAAGERLFIVEGGLHDPRNRIAYMSTEDALRMPVSELFRQADLVRQIQAHPPEHEAHQSEVARSALDAPVLSRLP